jgi:hypothetical protein
VHINCRFSTTGALVEQSKGTTVDMLRSTILSLALLPLAALADQTVTIKDVLYAGPVTAEAVSSAGNLDMPKLKPGPANETSYDWLVLSELHILS